MFEVAFFMKISTKKAGMRCGLCSTLRCTIPESIFQLKSIAKRQDISEKYLEQIIPQLVRAG